MRWTVGHCKLLNWTTEVPSLWEDRDKKAGATQQLAGIQWSWKAQAWGHELWVAGDVLLSWPRDRPWKVLAGETPHVYKTDLLRPN